METSGELYLQLREKNKKHFGKVEPQDFKTLFELIREELIRNTDSVFLDTCYTRLHYGLCGRAGEGFPSPLFRVVENSPYRVTFSDAAYVVDLLDGYLRKTDIEKDLQKWASRYFGRDLVPAINWPFVKERLAGIEEEIFRAYRRNSEFAASLQDACAADPTAQQIVLAASISAEQILSEARQREAQINALLEEKQKKTDELYDAGELAAQRMRFDAQNDIDELKKETAKTLEAAREEAARVKKEAEDRRDAVIQAAERAAERVIAGANARATEIRASAADERRQAEERLVQNGLQELQDGFFALQASVRSMEDVMLQSQLKKIFRAFFYVYEMLLNYRNAVASAENAVPGAPETVDSMIEMVIEGMEEFGIRPVCSAPGTPFSGANHEVQNMSAFDPSAVVVEKSVRCGFVYVKEGVVLEKEKILAANRE